MGAVDITEVWHGDTGTLLRGYPGPALNLPKLLLSPSLRNREVEGTVGLGLEN